jgi:hypothetical protein
MPPGEAAPAMSEALNVPGPAPAISATSDAPTLGEAISAPPEGQETGVERGPDGRFRSKAVDTEAKPADTGGTAEQAGEATGAVEKPGEVTKTDETPPEQAAFIARERDRRKAAEADRDAMRAELAEIKESIKALAPKAEPPKRPSREAFSDPDAYDAALIEWSATQARETATREAEINFRKQQQAQVFGQIETTWGERRTAFLAEHADFEDVAEASDVPITQEMSLAIKTEENGPAIAYHLGQNLDEAKRIAGLGPIQQAKAIGRLAERLGAAKPAPTPRAPKPEPMKPVGSRSNGAARDPAEMSMAEYAAYRAESLPYGKANLNRH